MRRVCGKTNYAKERYASAEWQVCGVIMQSQIQNTQNIRIICAIDWAHQMRMSRIRDYVIVRRNREFDLPFAWMKFQINMISIVIAREKRNIEKITRSRGWSNRVEGEWSVCFAKPKPEMKMCYAPYLLVFLDAGDTRRARAIVFWTYIHNNNNNHNNE